MSYQTAEADQPWVIYTFGRTHDGWWPFWNSTRVTGVAKIGMQCAICGERKIAKMRMPRVASVSIPEGGRHPIRGAFLLEHVHADKPHPMSWALPLLNPGAHQDGMDLDLLGMRLEADINETPTERNHHP